MNSLREWEEAFEQAVDVKKSYDLAKRMEGPKTNPVLGYRTAGSKAEWETGELLLKEMQEMGLQNVQKDKIKVDSWDFHHAVLRYRDKEGKEYEFQLGAYQTDFHTEGFQEFSMVYLGRGTAENYENIDVKGFVTNMSDLLKNYDLMLTKSGGATLFEAISSNTPIIVKNPKVGQEIENAKFIRDKGIGILYDTDEDLKELIKDLVNKKLDSRLIFMDKNISEFKKTIHPDKIADYIFQLLENN